MSPANPLTGLDDEVYEQDIDQSPAHPPRRANASVHSSPGYPFASGPQHHQSQPQPQLQLPNPTYEIHRNAILTPTGPLSFFDDNRQFHPNGFVPLTTGANFLGDANSIFPKVESFDAPPAGEPGFWHPHPGPAPQFRAGELGWPAFLQQVGWQEQTDNSSSNDQADEGEPVERGNGMLTFHQAPAQQPAGLTLAASPLMFANSIDSVQAAKNQIKNKNIIKRKPKLEDDVEEWAEERILRYAKKLFNAIISKSNAVHDNHTNEEKEKYSKSQEQALQKCKALLTTVEDVNNASARCVLTIHAIVELHRSGVPSTVVRNQDKGLHAAMTQDKKPPTLKTNGGYRIDLALKCSVRIQKIINEAQKTKLVAVHILTGEQLQELICAPDGFAARKRSNFRGNHKKQVQMSDGREAKKQEQPEGEEGEDTVQEAQIKTEKPTPKKKRKSGAVTAAPVDDEDGDINVEPPERPSFKRVKRNTGAQDVTHTI